MLAEEELRRCLALGADRLYRVRSIQEAGSGEPDPYRKSELLAKAVKLLEEASLDNQNGLVGNFSGHRLGIPIVSGIHSLEVDGENRKLRVCRNAGQGAADSGIYHAGDFQCGDGARCGPDRTGRAHEER